jgi:tetratricopeptide (TPR) repeat protein
MIQLIYSAEFEAALSLLKSSNQQLTDFLTIIGEAHKTEHIVFLSFFSYIEKDFSENDTYFISYSTLLATAFCHMNGSHELALFYCKRAIELAPFNKDYKQYLEFLQNKP